MKLRLRKSMLRSWLVTALLILSALFAIAGSTTSAHVSPLLTGTYTLLPSFTFHPSFTFSFFSTASSSHIFTFHPTFTAIFPTTLFTTVSSTTIMPSTDWAVLDIGLAPSNPMEGDLVGFSMRFVALSSNVGFPQPVYIQCQIDGFSCGAGTVNYHGPVGTVRTVTAGNYWPATVGPHILTWFVSSSNDPNPSNNILSVNFYVQPNQTPGPPQTIAPTNSTQVAVPTTVTQISVQTVTPTSSDTIVPNTTGGTQVILPDYLPWLVIVALLVVIILFLVMRKRGATSNPPKPAQ